MLTGCGAEDPPAKPADQSSSPTSAAAEAALPQSDEPVELDPADFTADVTNPWFPLEPGTRWTYRETTEDGEVVRVVVTATAVTREIANGVTARVVRDTVTLDGEIIEDTLDWYAQDARRHRLVPRRGHRRVRGRQDHAPARDPSKPASTAPRPA